MPDTSTEIATISTRAVRGHERVDFWVDHVARTLVRIECSGKSSEGIDAGCRPHFFKVAMRSAERAFE